MKKIRIGNDISIVWKVAKLGFVDLDKNSIAVQESDNRVNIVSPEIRWVEKKTTDTGVVDVEHLFSELFSNSKYYVIPRNKIIEGQFVDGVACIALFDLRQQDNNIMGLVRYDDGTYPPLRGLQVSFKDNPMSDNGVRISQRVRFKTEAISTSIELIVGDTYRYSDQDKAEYDNDSLWKGGVRPSFDKNTIYDIIYEDGVFSFEKYK